MGGGAAALTAAAIAAAIAAAYVFWRTVWFWRNPRRDAPEGGGVVSAADGTVVYVKRIASADDVVSIKRGLAARLTDIVREDVGHPKLLIGVFMSPFDVHYNRAPVSVTKIDAHRDGEPFPCYVVQIAAKTVAGIDSYVAAGQAVERGAIFGMIRIGSQVDVVVPLRDGMTVRVRPGDRVRAGETILVD